jgi:thiol-disulfide isomerase/thioredoxin
MRKTIFLFLLVLAGIGNAIAQNTSVINGTWEKRTPRTIKLFKVDNGALKEIASTVLTDENKFLFAFAPEQPAFYVIGLNPVTSMNNYTFYFKPGDNLNVVINAEGNKYTLTGDNTPENKEMARWHDFVLPLENKSVYFTAQISTYVDFFPLLEEKLKESSIYQQNYVDNPVFNEAFKSLRKFDMLYYALNFVSTPRSAQPAAQDFPDYYRNMEISDITSSDKLLDYPYGMGIVMRYHMLQPTVKSESLTEEQKKALRAPMSMLTYTLPQIVDDKIKGETVLMQTNYIKTYDGFLDYENKYGKYLITPSQKERFRNIITKVADNAQGQTAIDFKFTDKTGKEIALSDLKGKVVYIDIWATWCGPCRKEFPHFKKLEAEYHGNDNIAFMGISVDETKDKQKWLDFLQKEQLPGLQVFAGDAANAALMKPYKVTAIPHYILVGKDGKLISAKAPNPSSDEIRVALDAALKK